MTAGWPCRTGDAYDASPMAVYGIQALANGAYGRLLFPLDREPLLKGY